MVPQQQRQEQQEQQEEERLISPSNSPHRVSMGCFHVLQNTECNFYAGKISNCYDAWTQLTSDQWILNIVQGFEIEFTERPFQPYRPFPLRLSKTDCKALDTALRGFLDQDIIEGCDPDDDMFVSTVFPVLKKDGSARVILNLSTLNDFVENHHFKMDTIRDAIAMMRPGCFFASIDFKHAYYSVSVAEEYRKYLCFEWQKELFRFTALPQGLSSAPRVFTKLLKPALAHLRSLGYMIMIYIDDSLIIDSCSDNCTSAVNDALRLFDGLGLTVSVKKSVLRPVQRIEFLGFILDSLRMCVELTQVKKDKIRRLATQLLKRSRIQVRDLAEFIGNVVAAEPGVAYAPLYFKGLEIVRNKVLRRHAGSYDAWFTLSPGDRETLSWWVSNIQTSYKSLTYVPQDFVTESDASTKGWGCRFGDESTGGEWSAEEAESHINVLELKAAFLTLQTFKDRFHDCHVHLMMDNTTAIACINKLGSTSSELFEVTKQIYEWAIPRNVQLSAAHIPGVENVVADRESRTHNPDMEWKIREDVFHKLCEKFGTPDIDLFASRLNHQLENYVAWRPDPGAIAIDAFSMSWNANYNYAFPPFSMITRLLEKLTREGGQMLLIVPAWPTKPWYPLIGKHLAGPPARLPSRTLYLPQSPGQAHRLEHRMNLVACPLFVGSTNRKDSQSSSFPSWSPPGGRVHRSNTMCMCGSGLHFVQNKKLICLSPL